MQLPPVPPNTGQQRRPEPLGRPGHGQLPFEPYAAAPEHQAQTDLSEQNIVPDEGEGHPEGKPGIPRFLIVVLILSALVLVLRFQVFNIRNLYVKGLVNVPWQEVANAAGLNKGMFYYTVNEETIARNINSNRYLVFESMEKIFPNSLSVKVIERRPFAFFTHLGVGYVMAQDGIVLEETRDLKIGDSLIRVNGLMVWGQQGLGLLPVSTDPSQSENMAVLFSELELWGFDSQVSSIDIAQSLSISLLTKDGYAVNLGGIDSMHAKIGTVASVVNQLRRSQLTGGIIEASLPGEATYRAQ